MNVTRLFIALIVGFPLMTHAETKVQQVLASYEPVQSVTCEVRKETSAASGPKVRMLSRVHYEKVDKLHVETYSPLRRRIVANGQALYSHIEGEKMGFRRPVEELDREWQISLRKVPGTAMDHLLRLTGAPESDLPATDEFPVRKGYQVENRYLVLNFDDRDRLARIEFFTTDAMTEKTGTFDYSEFTEPVPGAWFPLRIKGVINFGDVVTTETTEIINLKVNEPVAPDIFKPGNYFKDIDFSPSFEEIYGN